jgi:hypothetical protein
MNLSSTLSGGTPDSLHLLLLVPAEQLGFMNAEEDGRFGARSCFLHQVESYYDILVMRTGEKERTPRLGAIKVRTRVSPEDLRVW